MAAKFRNVFFESYAAKARGNPRSQSDLILSVTLDRVSKDLANLFLGAAAMPASAFLELFLYVIIKLSNE